MTQNIFGVNIEEIIRNILTADEYEDVKIEVKASTEVNRILVNVKATKRGVPQDIELAANLGKSEKVSEGFKREEYVLKKVVPLFLDLQKYLKIQNSLTAFPKCYNTFIENGTGVLLVENLEKDGYKKIKGELNEDNYKLIVENIAKFHGLSFGLRYLHHEKFDEVLGNCVIINKDMQELAQFFNSRLEKLKFNLKLLMRLDLLKKFDNALERFGGDKIKEILNETVKNSVLVHGNYHQNCILLKYQEENATDVALEGFQASGLHSPVIDLSQFYFNSNSNRYFSNVSKFLKYYYEELSSFLKTLGCDAEEIFSFDTLLDHWQRYSFYGFCSAVTSLELGSLNLADILADFKDGENAAHKAIQTENNGAYRKKLEKIVEDFLDSEAWF